MKKKIKDKGKKISKNDDGLTRMIALTPSSCGDAERDMSTCPDCGMCPYNEE
jgi:hypothetical protein